ncbi:MULTISPECIES: murein L,D-transpeptidase [unclassified Nitratiruptor]|uniref:L,D-transpeptidase family protein n=1 Tax=unclassified Nitratiruptor TaxID=2624044 RepID=UPI001915309C|nr:MULTISPECIES: L,D-transpeptidase family protein [unclassified Nitratiruptor]BCD60535.1 hypothetical protein NitYY0810_C1303 [Nitratiruptor sp. YY08-10]BCD63976.1 L,D-transpeptidase YcbB [Nitratiruptor sp. YY08-14]
MRFFFLFLIPLILFSQNSEMNVVNNDSDPTPIFQSVWFYDNGAEKEELYTLMQQIKNDNTLLCKDRLNKPLQKLERLLRTYRVDANEVLKKDIEKLAYTLQLQYLYVRNNGCYRPEMILQDHYLPPKKKLYDHILRNPYLEMQYDILNKYESIKKRGGWGVIILSNNYAYLLPGKKYDEVIQLRWRLIQEGYLKDDNNLANTLYDENLKSAVEAFQKRHFLKPDGIVGPATLKALNESVESIIEKILINIERLRWYLQEDKEYVFVNIPQFRLFLWHDGDMVFDSKVIVGRKERPTPLMRQKISYAVLNPYWRAPKTIIAEDILPKLKVGKFEELEKEGIIASLDRYANETIPFDSIDWNAIDLSTFPIVFLQKPGPKNFLGFVKLMFPNKYDVYLHDTNARDLFRYSYRALSSGCVRVEKPIELFHLVEGTLSYREIFDRLWDHQTKKVRIRPKFPVYLMYMTIMKEDDGNIYFYPDIYQLDRKMKEYATILR